jgi:prepilin-type N-terminal cleavage/methylation domain-containing protein
VSRSPRRGERGFTLLEVLVALLVTIIGLAGVLMMQSNTARANRQNAEFTHASMIAEETMEGARGTDIDTLLNNSPITYTPQTDRGITYNITLTAARISTGSNLVLLTSAVSYSEDKDTSTADDRTARFQLLRTYTEKL